MTVQCFICEKVLKRVLEGRDSESVQPYDGLMFHSNGNYGSSLYDPAFSAISGGAPKLVIVICDECMKERQARGFLQKEERHPSTWTYETLDLAELPE